MNPEANNKRYDTAQERLGRYGGYVAPPSLAAVCELSCQQGCWRYDSSVCPCCGISVQPLHPKRPKIINK